MGVLFGVFSFAGDRAFSWDGVVGSLRTLEHAWHLLAGSRQATGKSCHTRRDNLLSPKRHEVGYSSLEERLSFRTLSCRKLSDRSFARLDSVPLRKAGVLTCSGRLIAQGLYALFNSSVIWQVRENQQRIGGKAG